MAPDAAGDLRGEPADVEREPEVRRQQDGRITGEALLLGPGGRSPTSSPLTMLQLPAFTVQPPAGPSARSKSSLKGQALAADANAGARTSGRR
jgi:hypothetical protein